MFSADMNWLLAFLRLIEDELETAYWNKNQEEINDPFQNSGNVDGFKNEVFEVHAYDWGNEPKYKYNFKWRDVEISWYKYLGRDMWINREIGVVEGEEMLNECIGSLGNL